MKKRLPGIALGVVLFVMVLLLRGLWPNREAEVQVVAWTLFAFGVVTVANRKHVRDEWFHSGLALCLLAHIVVVYISRNNLPFPNLGFVILIASVEAITFQSVFRRLS